MKKIGFTLAEVLITLGIIGVVAALTAPALISTSRNEANGAKLAVCISNLENAFSSAIASEGVDDLYGTRMWTTIPNGQNGVYGNSSDASRQRFTGELGRYLKLKGTVRGANPVRQIYASVGGIHPMSSNGGTNTDVTVYGDFPGNGQTFPIYMNNGAIVLIRVYRNFNANAGTRPSQATIDERVAAGTNYYSNAADIFIDVNGKTGPNTYGRDVFWTELGENGVIYPVGGLDVAIVDWQSANSIWSRAGHLGSCTDNDKGNRADTRGIGCAARLMEENYKMNY